MPGVDGIEATRHITADKQTPPASSTRHRPNALVADGTALFTRDQRG
jgi:CheY-like chemotaxis protein